VIPRKSPSHSQGGSSTRRSQARMPRLRMPRKPREEAIDAPGKVAAQPDGGSNDSPYRVAPPVTFVSG